MCLAQPAEIIEQNGMLATVEHRGVRLEVITAFVENPQPGDFVLVHAGFAIRKWDRTDVNAYRELIDGDG